MEKYNNLSSDSNFVAQNVTKNTWTETALDILEREGIDYRNFESDLN